LAEKKREEARAHLAVADVMVKDVMTVDEDATVKEAAGVMDKLEIGCLIAVKKGKATGILTERDLLKRIVAASRDAAKTKVKGIMSSPLVVVESSTDLEKAVRLMFQMKIKKLPVVDNKRLVGLVTLTDVARFQPQIMRILRELAAREATPKSMKKIVDYYIV
jgi:CBS-domain-containing membrane protein